MHRTHLLPAALAALALAAAAPAAGASPYVPGEVIVRYKDGTTARVEERVEDRAGISGGAQAPSGSEQSAIADGDSVHQTVSELRRDPNVDYAVPNYIARASTLIPNDPGFPLQWNLNGYPGGLNMPEAWEYARFRNAPGGRGAVVAVVDTGVAFERFGRFRRAPDLNRFVRGYDFVDGDRHPNDYQGRGRPKAGGHGTHVAGTIAQSTNNGTGAAGIAYRARIMPVRVLDRRGEGDTLAISRGIRFAAKRRVAVINLSMDFEPWVRAADIPDIISALRYARSKGVLVVAAAGNEADSLVALPARARHVMGVAASTIRGCQAEYSNSGIHVDVTAPGGGADAANSDNPYDELVCRPDLGGPFVFQQTFTSSVSTFGLRGRGFRGTSMAAAHVSGVAALVVASKVLGKRPSPLTLERHLEATARDAGPPGFDPRYGHGILDALNALR